MSAAAPVVAPATSGQPQVDTVSANNDFMSRSRTFPVRMPLIGGNLSGPYAVGSTLNFIMGPVNDGWLEAIELDLNIQITMATAVATPNKAFPWNLISAITVNLDGQISYVEPYFACYLLPRMKRRLGQDMSTGNIAGIQNTDEQNLVYNVPGSLAVGANNIRVRFYFPLNALHPLDGSGLLPTQGTQDPVQINVICPNQLIGPDPLLHPATSATGAATVTGTSTVTCYGWVRDGRTMWTPGEQLSFYPGGLPQVSYDREPDVINLVAGSIVRGQLTKVLKVYYGVMAIVDGNQSNNFAINTNINSWDLSADSSGNFKYKQYGLENVPVDLYFGRLRRIFGQDFPEGLIPFVYAGQDNLAEPGHGNGNNVLNMTQGGWTSLYQGVNLATIGGVAGIQPRVHTWILGTNDSPYIG